jgi:phosphotriesterase-related protein
MTAPDKTVQTVRGPIAPAELGFTLPHEHIYAKLSDFPLNGALGYGGMYGEVNVSDDDRLEEILLFKRAGGQTIVDVTLPGIGRNAEGLRAMSERSGVHVVMGCGWYREPYYPPQDVIDRRSADDLAEVLIREIRDGVDGTDVRPGIVGEIGANNSWLTAQEERVHRAAARAAMETGLCVTTHSPWSEIGLKQLRVLEEEGLDPNRVVIGHCCSHPVLSYYQELLDHGAYVQFDNIGQFDIPGYQDRVTALLLQLLEDGHAERLMLSHDVWNIRAFKFAGGTGYAHISESYIPELGERGVDEATIHTLMVENPRRVLTPV